LEKAVFEGELAFLTGLVVQFANAVHESFAVKILSSFFFIFYVEGGNTCVSDYAGGPKLGEVL